MGWLIGLALPPSFQAPKIFAGSNEDSKEAEPDDPGPPPFPARDQGELADQRAPRKRPR
jgi:hypothetical protein